MPISSSYFSPHLLRRTSSSYYFIIYYANFVFSLFHFSVVFYITYCHIRISDDSGFLRFFRFIFFLIVSNIVDNFLFCYLDLYKFIIFLFILCISYIPLRFFVCQTIFYTIVHVLYYQNYCSLPRRILAAN